MSVVVRGMDMPEDCIDCKIKQYDEYAEGFYKMLCEWLGLNAEDES